MTYLIIFALGCVFGALFTRARARHVARVRTASPDADAIRAHIAAHEKAWQQPERTKGPHDHERHRALYIRDLHDPDWERDL